VTESGAGEDRVEGSPRDPAAPVPEPSDAAASGAAADLSSEELGHRRADLTELMDLMREAVQQDGGDLVLTEVDYAAGIVDVELQGACGSCAISSMTLRSGVERVLKERLGWVREVRGEVDESLDYAESASLGRGAYVPKYY
jgi:Fe-S cluster biogenesis protein NfuA